MTLAADTLTLALDGVEGWLISVEAQALHDYAAAVPAGQCIVEIGSYRGRSTIALASGAPDGVLVYAIDPHHDHEAGGFTFGMADNQAFMQNVAAAGLGHKIRVINRSSFDAAFMNWDAIGMVWIDGGHEYPHPQHDVREWGNLLEDNGILAIHDSTGAWTEPTRVADDLKQSPDWTELESVGYTRFFRKDVHESE